MINRASRRAKLKVDDGRSGTGTATADVMVCKKVVVHYDKERYRLPDDLMRLEEEPELIKVVQAMREDPLLQVHIVSHTCMSGSPHSNMKLSQRRAEAMRDFLQHQGVSAGPMLVEWKGDTEPVATNRTEEGQAKNRRTEMILRPLSVQ